MSADDDDLDDDDDDEHDHSGGKTPAAIRALTLDALRRQAAALFERRPTFRSLMLSVAQYWADEADDAVHAHLVGSERATPVWPHSCDLSYEEAENEESRLPGEACWNCDDDLGYLDEFDDNGSAIAGFEPFCHEAGSQEESTADNYRPYAIARKVADSDEIAIEIVGMRLRLDGHEELIADDESDLALWPDARSQELFTQICASPADDAPRHVLADHLQERGDPHGEYLALALSTPDADARARRDALFAAHRAQWMDPLGVVIPEDGARFTRGFLTHADIYASGSVAIELVRGAEAWGTVESLRYLDESDSILDPAMVALREVGVLRGDEQIEALLQAPRPWAIESLAIVLHDRETIVALQRTTLLPRLRHLAFVGHATEALALLPDAAWWSQLDRVTILGDWKHEPIAALLALPSYAIAELDEQGEPTGWQLGFLRNGGLEITLAGWHAPATFAALVTRIDELPSDYRTVTLVPSRWYAPTTIDAERLAKATSRAVTVASGRT